MLKLNKEMKVKLDIFKKDKRSFYSFLILAFLFIATLPAELICNVRPIMIVVEGKPFFPITVTYSEKDFGGSLPSEPDYKSARFLSI
ncbi:MAG: peptide ABC transporter permease, partial [Nitrospina sp.]|nr:peptide ABC transporter permease [Nitrospina sp.]